MTTDERLRALEDAVRALLTQNQENTPMNYGQYRRFWESLHTHGAPKDQERSS